MNKYYADDQDQDGSGAPTESVPQPETPDDTEAPVNTTPTAAEISKEEDALDEARNNPTETEVPTDTASDFE